MKKKLLAMLFAAMATVAILPAMAFAASYSVWVNNVQVTDGNLDNVLSDEDATVSYSPMVNQLTLNGYQGGSIVAQQNLMVELKEGSENIITGDVGFSVVGSLTIMGDGDLMVHVKDHALGATGNVKLAGPGAMSFDSTDDYAVRLAVSGTALQLAGEGPVDINSMADGMAAVYNTADGTSPVILGDRYRQIGAPDEAWVKYKVCSRVKNAILTTNCKAYMNGAVVEKAAEWDLVTVKADPAPKGKVFCGWRAVGVGFLPLTDVYVNPMTFAMSGEVLVIEPIYKEKLVSTKVTLSSLAYAYNGSAKKPSVTVKNAAGTVICSARTTGNANVDIFYASGRTNVGTYKVTVVGKGKYTGTVTKTFKVNPPATAVKSLVGKTKSFTVTWTKKIKQVDGYQIRYKLSTSSTWKTPVVVKGYATTSKTIKNLKAKKKYNVEVRTYKVVSGKTYYSSWTKKKTVATR